MDAVSSFKPKYYTPQQLGIRNKVFRDICHVMGMSELEVKHLKNRLDHGEKFRCGETVHLPIGLISGE